MPDPAPAPNPAPTTPTIAASPATSDPRQRAAIGVAIGSLVIFTAITAVLFFRADATDPVWSHYLFLYNGIQAIAFAGAGFLFGKEVNRGRAEAAEQNADQERQRADVAAEGAANGAALATQLKTKAAMAAAAGAGASAGAGDEPAFAGVGGRGVQAATGGSQDHLEELARVADKLFPRS